MNARLVQSALLCGFITLAACNESDSAAEAAPPRSRQTLIVSHAFAPAPAAPDVMALYFSIENTGQSDDTLLTITTDVAQHANVHESITENGVTRMQAREHLALPAGQTVELAPGALHVMLTQLTQTVHEGDTLRVDLTFAAAPPMTLRIPVVSYADAVAR